MTKAKNMPHPHDGNIYDDDDNVLVHYMTGRPDELLAVARDVATKRGEMVYAYLGNGREAIEPAPSVGMGCTISWLNDRAACTVVKVSPSGRKVVVRRDCSVRTDDNGMSQSQSYTFERDPNGELTAFYRQGDGSYAASGKRLTLGKRSTYHCFEY